MIQQENSQIYNDYQHFRDDQAQGAADRNMNRAMIIAGVVYIAIVVIFVIVVVKAAKWAWKGGK